MPGAVPGTALATLLAAGAVRDRRTGAVVVDPYVDDVLSSGIADMSETGVAAWTLAYVASLAPAAVSSCAAPPLLPAAARVLLTLPQASYRVSLFSDGGAALLLPLARAGLRGGGAAGMYRRFDYSLGAAQAWCRAAAHGLAAVVAPPDHPGNVSSSCAGCGQGGNHALAQDVVAQDGGGWDWQRGVPDRGTGLLDGVDVAVVASGVLLRDGAVTTTALAVDAADPPARRRGRCASACLRSTSTARAVAPPPAAWSLRCPASASSSSRTRSCPPTAPGTRSTLPR